MTERVTLFEMAPRDGLQNEATLIATADKIELVDQLSDAGFQDRGDQFRLPRWVPRWPTQLRSWKVLPAWRRSLTRP